MRGGRAVGVATLLLLAAPAVQATSLNLRVESGGQGAVSVPPGVVVPYVVVGELSDAQNDGLAMFSFDLSFSGGALSPAASPSSAPMTRFAVPAGINNPQGFGGVPVAGALLQVGGAQNTLNNTIGPFPVGSVITGLAWPGQALPLVSGQLTAPLQPGRYTLTPAGLVANVIVAGATGDPVWKVEAAGSGILLSLTVDVQSPATASSWVQTLRSLAAGFPALSAGPGPIPPAPVIQPRMGEPLAGLSAEELVRFLAGRDEFGRTLPSDEGLGPIFNDTSCSTCHSRPRPGGFGSKRVTRFGRAAVGSTPFDPLAALGGSLLQSQALAARCQEVVPPQADVTAERLTTPVFGAGLVEAIPDADIAARAASPPEGVSGRVHHVEPFEAPGVLRVGRFGWKAQVATLLTFSADASLNEMGLTNRFLTVENAPNGDEALLATCDGVADPEDGPDADGLDRIDRQTSFQRFLAPPPQTPRLGMRGEALFERIGCARCHASAPYVTGATPEPGLAGRSLKPYSDFLLHDMGGLGDGIVQGEATEAEQRTPPLWGLRVRAEEALLHDGRATGGTAAENLRAAILAHEGEGAPSVKEFGRLRLANRQRLLDFLLSLGRAEFDYEGDNDVDDLDWVFLRLDGRFTGPGPFFTPDDPGAIADFDADGDFDLVDVATLQRAATGDLLGSNKAERRARVKRAVARGRPVFDREWGAARVGAPRTGSSEH